MYESSDKMVSHPDHYQSETGLEVIDVIEAFTFDLKGEDINQVYDDVKKIFDYGFENFKRVKLYT